MARKKNSNRKNEIYDDVFNLFAIIALYPIDYTASIKSYTIGIILSVSLAVLWAVPMFFIGSIVASMFCIASLLIKLIKNLIYGN